MRIVLDTNVLVSGLLSPFGAPGQIVRMVASGDLSLCYDGRILLEYREVLLRPKFPFSGEFVDSLPDQIVAAGLLVAACPLDIELPDRSDEWFLELAVSGEAEALVTGNLRHFPKARRQGVLVLTPADFLERYRKR